MKQLDQYIIEKFKLSTKNTKRTKYKYFPKTRDELRSILEERLSKNKNANLNNIDVSQITDMNYLFWKLKPRKINISEWDVSNVTDMRGMFYYCTNFNCDISEWDVSNVKDMHEAFSFCCELKGDLSKWDVSNVNSFEKAFYCDYKLSNEPNFKK